MSGLSFDFTNPLWLWQGKGAWHFITVTSDVSSMIKALTERRGFGSVRVSACINDHLWKTSIFPDSKTGCYLLPVKAQIRKATGLRVGDLTRVLLELDF